MKRALVIGAFVAALGGLTMTLLARGRTDAPAPVGGGSAANQEPTAASSDAAPAPAPSGLPAPFLGVVLARETVDVAARSEGRLASVQVRLGDRVKQDQVLGSLDSRAAQGDVAMADAGLRTAQAEVDRAALEVAEAHDRLGRIQPLSEGTPAISGDELERARYQEKIAMARLDAARAALHERRARTSQARTALDEAVIRAPFDGTITGRFADPGAMVGRGAAIVRLISSDDLLVRFAVPEPQAPSIVAGLRVKVALGEGEADLSALSGSIEKVAPEVDAASRMVVVEARLEVPQTMNGQILAGREARVTVIR